MLLAKLVKWMRGLNWPWLGLRAMLPEFKASSKRLNIVCNLEAEEKKGQGTAKPDEWNEHINATQIFIFSLTTSRHVDAHAQGLNNGGGGLARMLWSPSISSNMWTAALPVSLYAGWQVGVSHVPAENHKPDSRILHGQAQIYPNLDIYV